MRIKSQRVIITCQCCNESYRIKKPSKIQQEAEVAAPPEKRNPFNKIKDFNILVQDYSKVADLSLDYEMVICIECGNIFGILTKEKFIKKKPIDENDK